MVANVEELGWQNETSRQISGLGTMPAKPESQQFTMDEPILGGTKAFSSLSYGLAVELSFEMVEDDLYGIMRELIGGLKRASMNRMEVDGHKAHNRAFNTSFVGFTAAESLCSTSHALLNGSTAANRPTVDIELSVTAVQGAIQRYHNMVDDRGLPRLMSPSLWVITPTYLWIAREIFGSGGKPYTADNEINAIVEEDELNYMINHYITTSTNWFAQSAKGEHDIKFKVRTRPMFDMFDDRRTKTVVCTAFQRHAEAGFRSFRGVDGSTGA